MRQASRWASSTSSTTSSSARSTTTRSASAPSTSPSSTASGLPQDVPAVHQQVRAAAEGGLVAQEVADAARHLLDRAQAADDGHVLPQGVMLGVGLRQRRADVARRKRVDPDSPGGPLDGKG